ncbi:ABC transporter permease subunit [Nocardia salmonicida]|uniref:ABC transporter permease subunit n=1 Tax=Nocardia salmonicida TaxID=53431 RepID=UPI0007A515A9|nr:hypothetical protein [Nocardia salmonicida]
MRQAWDIQAILLFALGAVVVAWLYQRTRTARLLRASRENMLAAPGVGIHVTRHRVIAFVLSAGICGVGGSLWAETNTVVNLQSGLTVGGLLVTIPDGARPLILGAVLILILLFRPQGVTSGRELRWPRRRAHRMTTLRYSVEMIRLRSA